MRKEFKLLFSTVAMAALLAGCGQAATTSSKKAASSSSPAPTSQTTKKHADHTVAKAAEAPTAVATTPTATATLAAPMMLKAASQAPATYTPATKTLTVNAPLATKVATQQTANQAAPTPTKATTTLAADQLTLNQKFGLYTWYTSKHVTNEALPVTNRPLSVTIMNESSVLAPLPNGTNNTYYQVYGSTADNGEWVNYYAQSKDVAGSDKSVYLYQGNQWNQYQLNDMVNTANQEQAGAYVNQVANNVQVHDER
ncbi:hypothetical protein [Limosilactobacillus ingluviei]|nr:hypothetical protein [Limosilactobacillus ingluviei]